MRAGPYSPKYDFVLAEGTLVGNMPGLHSDYVAGGPSVLLWVLIYAR